MAIDVRLGFNGYWLQQLTDHEINGVAVPNSRERSVGLGPEFSLAAEESGSARIATWKQTCAIVRAESS